MLGPSPPVAGWALCRPFGIMISSGMIASGVCSDEDHDRDR